ncbi:MAG: 8-amino-7-oxononanoate synthase [Solirubrobacterales bacterium]
MNDVEEALEQAREAGLLRQMREVETATGPHIRVDGRDVLLLCSNDYLGLASDARVRRAAAEAAETWGAGAGASRLVSGNLSPHVELEARLAEFKRTGAAVLFGSGYLANMGVVAAVATEGGVVFSDELNHASLVDGCRLAGAETVIYPHGDVAALAEAMEGVGDLTKTIVTDSVFSMDGDVAPLAEIVELAERYRAKVIVDEAHATGTIGPGGRGLISELGLEDRIDVTVGTLSKALGSYGAYACCSRTMGQYLVNKARPLIFSTGLPPSVAAAASESIRILDEEDRESGDRPGLVDTLRSRALTFRRALVDQGVEVEINEIPIVPLVIGEAVTAMSVCEKALEEGVFAQAIRPPTVPEGTSRLRLTVMATHTDEDLESAAKTLAEAVSRRSQTLPLRKGSHTV